MVDENTTTKEEITMATPSVDIKSLVYTEGNLNAAINTKEEAEILNGLFQGNHIYETFATERALRLSKIIDMF